MGSDLTNSITAIMRGEEPESAEGSLITEGVQLAEGISGYSANELKAVFASRMKQQLKDFMDIQSGKKDPTLEMKAKAYEFRKEFNMDFVIPLDSKNPMKDGRFKKVSRIPLKNPSISQQIFSEEVIEEDSGSKEKYQAFFQSMLKKSKFDSVEDMSDDEKKKFFNMVDKKWNADDEAGKDGLTEDGGCDDCKKEDCECDKAVTKEERMIEHLEAVSEALLEKWNKKKSKKEDVNIDIDADDDDDEKSDDDKEEKDSDDKKEKSDDDEKVKLDKKKEKVNKDPELKEDMAISIKRIKDLLDA